MFRRLREKIIHWESKILFISVFITSISIVSKLLGFLKIHFIARLFATSKESDIFFAAFALPDLVFTLLVVGTVNAALVPIFIRIIKKNQAEVLHTTLNTVITLLFGTMIVLLGIIYIFMPQITTWVFTSKEVLKVFDLATALTQENQEHYQELFLNLSRLMLVSPLLLSVSSIFGAYLQAHKRFISTAIAPLMYNLGILLGITLFVKFAPHFGIYALSYAVLLGTALHFITQLIGILGLHEKDFSWSFGINQHVRDIAKLSLPRIFGLGVEQIAIMFNTFWGFTLGTGALSVFKYASTLYLVPVDLISGSFLQVIFPRLNERAHERAQDNNQSLNKLYWRTLVLLCYVAIPIAVLFIVLRLPIVRLILGAGRFDWTATIATSFTLAFFTPAILFQAMAALNIRTFYALNNTKIPLLISLTGVISNITFSILFTNFFSHASKIMALTASSLLSLETWQLIASWFFTRGNSFTAVAGLAFGISIGLFLEVALSFWLLSRQTQLWAYAKQVVLPLQQIKTALFGGIATFIVGYTTYRITDLLFDSSRVIGVVLITGLTGILAGIVYLLATSSVWKQYIQPDKVLRKIVNVKNKYLAKSV